MNSSSKNMNEKRRKIGIDTNPARNLPRQKKSPPTRRTSFTARNSGPAAALAPLFNNQHPRPNIFFKIICQFVPGITRYPVAGQNRSRNKATETKREVD